MVDNRKLIRHKAVANGLVEKSSKIFDSYVFEMRPDNKREVLEREAVMLVVTDITAKVHALEALRGAWWGSLEKGGKK